MTGSTPYAALFGRNTFDMFAKHADENHPMTPFKKYVATSHPADLGWMNSEAVTGDIPDEIERLKQQPGPLIQVHGSHELVQTLLAHDLVDELRLWTFPVVVGAGKRLFGGGVMPVEFSLMKTGSTSNGVIMGIYRRQT